MQPDVFYDMLVGEFWEALSAYREEKDSDRRHIGELVRGATHLMWNLIANEKSRIDDPCTFWPMPWDEASEDKAAALANMTKEERDASARRLMQLIDNNG